MQNRKPESSRCGLLTISLILATALLLSPLMGASAENPPATASAQVTALAEEAGQEPSTRGEDAVFPDLEQLDQKAFAALIRLQQMNAIDPSGLSRTEIETLEILKWNAWVATQQPRLYWYYSPLMPARSPLRGVQTKARFHSLKSAEDVTAYLQLIARAGNIIEGIHTKVQGQLDRGIALPLEQIDRSLTSIQALTEVGPQNPFWVSEEKLAELPGDQAAAAGRITEALAQHVAPPAAALANFVDHAVRAKAPEGTGWSIYPGGKEAYRIATRVETTLDISPEEVHAIGLRGVDNLNQQMAQVREQLGFKGTKAKFHERLRKDKRFYVDTPEAFGAALLAFDAKIAPLIDQQFTLKPKAPHNVRRLNPALEPTMTYGYYNLPNEQDETGYYNYNGSELASRSLLSGGGLTYHELVPGHHFQLTIQAENENLPKFRQRGYYAGNSEGWGEYTSSVVARELGMYEDPYDLYGRLVFDMFFAVRLVVDTGMNYFGWSRDKARAYMAEHTMESAVQIDSETIRYSMRSPAQALAYRMGLETWVRLRRHAEEALGQHFDVRRFHDSVLSIGSVPLPVLEDHVNWFIASEQK